MAQRSYAQDARHTTGDSTCATEADDLCSCVCVSAACMSAQPLQQKRLAARRHSTTYCYDFPSVFDNALRGIWAARAAGGEPQSVPPPGKLVETHELVLAGESAHTWLLSTACECTRRADMFVHSACGGFCMTPFSQQEQAPFPDTWTCWCVATCSLLQVTTTPSPATAWS